MAASPHPPRVVRCPCPGQEPSLLSLAAINFSVLLRAAVWARSPVTETRNVITCRLVPWSQRNCGQPLPILMVMVALQCDFGPDNHMTCAWQPSPRNLLPFPLPLFNPPRRQTPTALSPTQINHSLSTHNSLSAVTSPFEKPYSPSQYTTDHNTPRPLRVPVRVFTKVCLSSTLHPQSQISYHGLPCPPKPYANVFSHL